MIWQVRRTVVPMLSAANSNTKRWLPFDAQIALGLSGLAVIAGTAALAHFAGLVG